MYFVFIARVWGQVWRFCARRQKLAFAYKIKLTYFLKTVELLFENVYNTFMLNLLSVFQSTAMKAGFYVCIALFAAISVTHLVFCFLMIPFWRKITKPLCLVLLGGAMCFLVPDYPLVWISCFLSAVGDILLINNRVPRYFIVGAVVFAAAHTLNAVNQVSMLSYAFPWYAWLILAVIVVCAGIVGYFTRGKENAAEATVSLSYACFHFINIALAIMLMADGAFVEYELLILFGYLIYVVSDLIVNYVTNKRDINRRDFYIMITYLAGQTLIYFGLAFALMA